VCRGSITLGLAYRVANDSPTQIGLLNCAQKPTTTATAGTDSLLTVYSLYLAHKPRQYV